MISEKIKNTTYEELLESCRKYRKIAVSGPQRSGTTFCSQALAKDLDYVYIDEAAFNYHDHTKFLAAIENCNSFVVQCPGVSYLLQELNYEDLLIVFMYREVEDIIRSQQRISWDGEETEKKFYRLVFKNIDLSKPISEIKYKVWEDYQRNEAINGKPLNYIEFYYKNLSSHPDFVDREKRKDFHAKQTVRKKD